MFTTKDKQRDQIIKKGKDEERMPIFPTSRKCRVVWGQGLSRRHRRIGCHAKKQSELAERFQLTRNQEQAISETRNESEQSESELARNQE